MNILMLVILIYTVSVMPINTAVFGIDFSRVFAPEDPLDTTLGENNLQLAFTPVNPGDLRISPKSYQVHLDSSKPLTDATLKKDLKLTLSLTDTLGHMATFTEKEIAFDIKQSEERYTLSLHIDQPTLGTAFDNYQAKITISLGNETFEDSFPILYVNEGIQPNGTSAKTSGKQLAPYFYTDSTGNHSIPIFVATQPGNNPYRRMINTLNQAPQVPYLSGNPAFPPVKHIWYSAGLLELRLNSAVLEAYGDPKVAQAALNNVINTARYFSRDTVINKVRLTIDGAQTSKAFGGLSLSQEYLVDRSPQSFIPLIADNTMLWLPLNTTSSDNITETVQRLVAGLQKPHTLIDDPRAAALFPESVQVKQATLVNNRLRVTFSSNIVSELGDRPELIRTILEGLSLSLSTIPEVQGIELYADGSKLTNLGSVQLPEVLNRPDYFNVLK